MCGDGKALLDTLQTPVTSSSANSITAKADYSEAAGHVLDVVHEVGCFSSNLADGETDHHKYHIHIQIIFRTECGLCMGYVRNIGQQFLQILDYYILEILRNKINKDNTGQWKTDPP